MKSFRQVSDDVFTTQFRDIGSGTPLRGLLPLRDFFTPADQFTARELERALYPLYLKNTLRDLDGHQIAFVEYTPDSEQTRCRGKYLGAKRVSTRLWHTGVAGPDETLVFPQIWRIPVK